MKREATYQQLRSHLAYLKLTALAEELPAALEQAERDKPGYTKFLTDLLEVEVAATEQRRLQGRLRFANFPHTLRAQMPRCGALAVAVRVRARRGRGGGPRAPGALSGCSARPDVARAKRRARRCAGRPTYPWPVLRRCVAARTRGARG